jgi:1-acyl-sn-glycerol-3-phosphate acyltransferase
MRRRMDVRIAGLPADLPAGLPLLLVANHVSWWDGFLLREVHRALRPDSPLHPVMLASELSRRWVLRALGGVGIDARNPGTIATAIRTLREQILRHPETVVIFFPQGRIWPSHRRPLGFQRGVELFARRLAPATILPVAIHIEPLHRVSPTAFLLAGEAVRAGSTGGTAAALENSIEGSLDAVHDLLARRGEAALAEWPSPFQTLEYAR